MNCDFCGAELPDRNSYPHLETKIGDQTIRVCNPDCAQGYDEREGYDHGDQN